MLLLWLLHSPSSSFHIVVVIFHYISLLCCCCYPCSWLVTLPISSNYRNYTLSLYLYGYAPKYYNQNFQVWPNKTTDIVLVLPYPLPISKPPLQLNPTVKSTVRQLYNSPEMPLGYTPNIIPSSNHTDISLPWLHHWYIPSSSIEIVPCHSTSSVILSSTTIKIWPWVFSGVVLTLCCLYCTGVALLSLLQLSLHHCCLPYCIPVIISSLLPCHFQLMRWMWMMSSMKLCGCWIGREIWVWSSQI